jgi:hypothetical protein
VAAGLAPTDGDAVPADATDDGPVDAVGEPPQADARMATAIMMDAIARRPPWSAPDIASSFTSAPGDDGACP